MIITEKEFFKKYQPIQNPFTSGGGWDNCMVETYDEELEYVKAQNPCTVWTIVNGEGDTVIILNGFHWVDRLAYIVTKKTWVKGEDISVQD